MKTSKHSLLKGLAFAAIAQPLLATNMFASGENLTLFATTDPAAMTIGKALLWLFFGVVASIICLFAMVSEKSVLRNQTLGDISRNLSIPLTELDGDAYAALHGFERAHAPNKPEHAVGRSGEAAVEYHVEYAANGRPIVQTVATAPVDHSVEYATNGYPVVETAAPAAVDRPVEYAVEYAVEYDLAGRPVVQSVDAASNGNAVGRMSERAEGGAVGRIAGRTNQTSIQAFIEKSVDRVIAENA